MNSPVKAEPDSNPDQGRGSRRGFLKGVLTAGAVGAAGNRLASALPLREANIPGDSAGPSVPSLDDLCCDWVRMSTLGVYPAINNFWGALQATDNLLAVTELTFPPFSQSGHSGNLSINGQPLQAQESRWYAYQILRRTRLDDLEVETSVRMVFEGRGILLRVKLRNLDCCAQPVEVGADLVGQVGRFEQGWSWQFPHPGNPEHFAASLAGRRNALLVRHTQSSARVAFAFATPPQKLESQSNRGSAAWRLTLIPTEERTIDLVMAVGNSDDEAVSLARQWAGQFESAFEAAKTQWEKRWKDAFAPHNGYYSGNLPVLATRDAKMRRVYYMGILSRLQLLRTNFAIQPRIIVTSAPQYSVTVTYFWDNTLFLMSLLDPEMMRQELKRWLTIDIAKWYAQDCLTGDGRGLWYSANNLSVFAILQGHLRVTGDYGLLDEKAGQKTVLEHMQGLVTGWKPLVRKETGLADYGGANDLLECDPTYTHSIASLNAANVGMMRMMADLLEWRGDAAGAAELRTSAQALAAAVLKLYVPVEGVWNCAQPGGEMVKVRHVYDFITTVKWMFDDLTPAMRREMAAFVERELMAEGWMRALSLRDPAAPDPDRPDHGPLGAYDEWPPLTLEALRKLGFGGEALDAFYRFEKVTYEGPYAQAHELLGREWDAPVRIAGRGQGPYNGGGMTTHNMIGTVFTELIVASFFGFQPDWQGERVLVPPCLPSGFRGELQGVLYRGKHYNLSAGPKGVTFKPA